MTQLPSPILVLGAGSWGTALAIHLARNQQPVRLWARNAEFIKALQKEHCNKRYLPAITLPPIIELFSDISQAMSNVADVILAVPSQGFRATLQLIKPFFTAQTRLILTAKGLDPVQHQLLHVVVKEVCGDIPFAVLSGPTFAKEVAAGLATAVTIASEDKLFLSDLVQRFHHKIFRVYTSSDISGVELGGAIKNVMAIAVGIADGLGLGANARSALITRGLAEMVRIGVALGGKQETFMGLAGLGDLILTCTDNQSRNRRFGLALGVGKNRQEAEKHIAQVVEGIYTAKEIHYLAQNLGIQTPIVDQVYAVLYEDLPPSKAVDNLLSREPRAE